MTQTRADFIGYEYKDVTVRRDMEAIYADSFPSFGWQIEGTGFTTSPRNVVLKFKRNRRITNKAELTRLQREFEGHIHELERLEDFKFIVPSAVAYAIGIFGTAFIAGSVFAMTATLPLLPLSIILAVPGIIGWIVPYFAYLKLKKKKTDIATPVIDRQYDAIYEVCEKASALANA